MALSLCLSSAQPAMEYASSPAIDLSRLSSSLSRLLRKKVFINRGRLWFESFFFMGFHLLRTGFYPIQFKTWSDQHSQPPSIRHPTEKRTGSLVLICIYRYCFIMHVDRITSLTLYPDLKHGLFLSRSFRGKITSCCMILCCRLALITALQSTHPIKTHPPICISSPLFQALISQSVLLHYEPANSRLVCRAIVLRVPRPWTTRVPCYHSITTVSHTC